MTPPDIQPRSVQLGHINSYKGAFWTNAPGMMNIVYSLVETAMATSALFRAWATNDKEGKRDAGCRLLQQPISFCGALLSLAIQALEGGIYFKFLELHRYLPIMKIVATGLGLGLCSIELVIESIGLKRAACLLLSLYHSSTPAPDLSQVDSPEIMKKKLVTWAQKIINNPEPLHKALGDKAAKQVFEQLESLLDEPENGTEVAQEALDQLMLADLIHIKNKYLAISAEKVSKINEATKANFPKLKEEELEAAQEKALSQKLTRKGSNLARRVQPWFAEELAEKLDPLVERLSNPDPEVRSKARAEAKQMLDTLDEQAKKKLIAHIIGLVGLLILSAGLIAGLLACPYAIPLALITAGGILAFVRQHFSSGYWNSRGWTFDKSACVPPLVKWVYYKLSGLKKWTEEKTSDSWPKFNQLVAPLSLPEKDLAATFSVLGQA